MLRIVTAVSTAIILSSCATTPRNYQPEISILSFPDLNSVTTVSLGEDMLRQGKAIETDGIVLRQDNNIQNHLLSPGFYPTIGEDKDWTFHEFQIGSSFAGRGTLTLTGGLFGPKTYPQSIKASKTEQKTCIVPNGLGSSACDTEVPFSRERRPSLSVDYLQQTLIYSGRVGDKIRIGYRESAGGMARQAFSNEAEYDLSTSSEIAYRGARIRVLEADNQKIKYEVLSNFNTQ